MARPDVPASAPTTVTTPAAGSAPPISDGGRAEVRGLADHLLLALRPWASDGHARFDLPGPASRAGRSSDGLEAFARSFLAAGFRLSADDRDEHDHAGWYAAGLVNGTAADGPECWPRLEHTAQARVEAAAVAIGLHESRARIWDRLGAADRTKIIDWLADSCRVSYPDNNWLWFCNVTQAFLRSVDGPYDQRLIDANIARMEDWYLGSGWYTDGRPDGRTGNVDWYNGWVMQLFALWYCRMSAGLPGVAELEQRYRRRLREYLSSAALLFGADGAPLFQGRSLVYRYATVGAIWAGAIFDADPWQPGTLRRIALRGVRYFTDRGAINDDGLLSLGWLDAYEKMRQPYSGPGSPYWSSLGLAGLVIDADDPFWTAPEQPMPVERGSIGAALPEVGWLVSGTDSDGIVRVINHGVDHSGADPGPEKPLYGRLGYSTVTAPIDPDPDSIADNQVTLIGPDGERTRRDRLQKISADGRVAASSWGPIRCWSVTHDGVEVRIVRLADGPVPAGSRLAISGYPVPRHPVPGARTGLQAPVTPLLGTGRVLTAVHDRETPFGSSIVIARVEFDPAAAGESYAVAVQLFDGPAERSGPLPEVTEIDGGVRVGWPDGSTDSIRF